jgi:hypothetical protein
LKINSKAFRAREGDEVTETEAPRSASRKSNRPAQPEATEIGDGPGREFLKVARLVALRQLAQVPAVCDAGSNRKSWIGLSMSTEGRSHRRYPRAEAAARAQNLRVVLLGIVALGVAYGFLAQRYGLEGMFEHIWKTLKWPLQLISKSDWPFG